MLAAKGNSADVKAEVAASLLLVGRGQNDAAHSAAASFLRRAGPVPAAAKYAISALSKGFQGQTADVAMSWINRNRNALEIGEVLSRVLNKQAPQELQDLAQAYVERFMGRQETGPVLLALAAFQRTKSFYSLQDRWLARTNDAPRALGIYRHQLQTAHWHRYAGRALALVQAHPDIRGAQDILSLLIRKRGTHQDVLEAARA